MRRMPWENIQMTKRSDKWDRAEKFGALLKKSLFNVNLLILIGIIVFGATFAYVHFVVPPYTGAPY